MVRQELIAADGRRYGRRASAAQTTRRHEWHVAVAANGFERSGHLWMAHSIRASEPWRGMVKDPHANAVCGAGFTPGRAAGGLFSLCL